MSYDVLEVCRHVINYSNEQDYGISNLKLQKVLYKIESWDFGPVIPCAYNEYKQYANGDIPTIESYYLFDTDNIWNTKRVKFNDDVILDEDKKRIDRVIDSFSEYTATDLVSLTHKQSPWINSYVPNQNNEISIDAIKRYFQD